MRDSTEFFVSLGMLAVLLAIYLSIASYGCSSKWERSGFKTDWGPIQGCLISKDGKEWIPADNYREIP